MQEFFDFAIIGGGASGMAAAVSAASCGDRVLLIEKNNALGRKISASGNGRCNLMNAGAPRYFGDSGFAGKVLEKCSKETLLLYWDRLGIRLCEENEGRMYPCTFHSSTVTDAYKIRLKSAHVELRLQTAVRDIAATDHSFSICTENESFRASRVLIACGGPASPKLGGTACGARFLAGFGHSVLPARPALCPLETDTRSVSGLSGIRVKCAVELETDAGKMLSREEGEVLFTDYGISGICVMQTARFAEPGFRLMLDLIGRVIPDPNELIRMLIRRQKQVSDFPPETLLTGILVPRLSYAVLKQAGIEIKGRKAGDLSESEIRAVAEKCRSYTLTVTGSRGMEEAQVTAGGADCGEFNPENMESLLVHGLYAAGEVLNVDGDCGGFNLMFATASGILAGLNGREGL